MGCPPSVCLPTGFRCRFFYFLLALSPGLLAGIRAEDVVVYGGTPAGLMAGMAAARAGASVVVVEPSPWIGGMVAGGLSRTDKGREETVGGLAREFFTRAAGRRPETPLWYAEPSANLATFEEMAGESGLRVVRGQPLVSVRMKDGRIHSFQTSDGAVFTGSIFVDATYFSGWRMPGET